MSDFAMLEAVIDKMISENVDKALDGFKPSADAVKEIVESAVNDAMEQYKKTAPRKLIVQLPDKEKELPEAVRHAKFDDMLHILAAGKHVWAFGAAGTGKSVLAKQLAEALDASYHYTGAIMDEYAGLKGFIDANGTKHGTEFTRALDDMNDGKEVVMCFDECDGSVPEVMVTLNNLLSGGVVECMGTLYEYKPNLHVIACGNTNGRGGSNEYVRSILDQATLDRFAFVPIDYDEGIERAIAGDDELLEFVRSLRNAVKDTGTDLLVTYRTTEKLRDIGSALGRSKALDYTLKAKLDEGDVNVLRESMSLYGNEWYEQFVW